MEAEKGETLSMTPTHKCDYCGENFYLSLNEAVISCSSCGQHRIYDLVNNRPTMYYQHTGDEFITEVEEELEEDDEESLPKKHNKTSKDIKSKRTCNSYSMKSKMRNSFRRG